jgi:ribonucleoside-triphosphate reductase
MKDVHIIAALPTKAEICVLKNNGIFEKFSHEKIVKSCLLVGSSV